MQVSALKQREEMKICDKLKEDLKLFGDMVEREIPVVKPVEVWQNLHMHSQPKKATSPSPLPRIFACDPRERFHHSYTHYLRRSLLLRRRLLRPPPRSLRPPPPPLPRLLLDSTLVCRFSSPRAAKVAALSPAHSRLPCS